MSSLPSRFLSYGLLLGLLSACSTAARVKTADATTALEPADPAVVQVFPVGVKAPAHELVGVVVAACDAGEDSDKALAMLQREAAQLGADAVVDTRMEFEYGFWRIALKVSGMAAKLK